MKLQNSWKSLMAMATLVAFAGSVYGDWVDNFNDYTGPGVILDDTNSAPWDVNHNYLRTSDDGSGGYCVRSSENNRGAMVRASDAGDTTLVFDFQLLGFTSGSFEVTMSQEDSLSSYNTPEVPYIGLEVDSRNSGGKFDNLRFVSYNASGTRLSMWDLRDAGLSDYVWYNAKVVLEDNGTVTYGYKLRTDTVWTESIGNAIASGFAFNHVALCNYEGSGGQGGYIDNVGSVPEPTTMALLASGGLLVIRRKR